MRSLLLLLLPLALSAGSRAEDDFPVVADDLEVSLFAREPLVRNPCAITFDARGRLCVGMGPQYRTPKPDTPGDSVWILLDEDGDGSAEGRTEFATGFNAIQGLAWRGRDLYVANAPDLTIARDLDGDDVADEYVRLFTDLGNLEHGLHGLNFGLDGKLYMSKGNSKGLTRPPDRVAPKPFRDLWGIETPGLPDFPDPVVFRRDTYRKNYHHPADDWGLCGGVLRCDPDGSNLEIVARGFRNPWDICYDDGFDWLGTDNDQTLGDKIFSPFFGAHFGWGHPWSYDWKGDQHLPTAPSSGPLFEGSGTGVVFCGLDWYPDTYRGTFLINDWLRREVYLYRPVWKGAWMQPDRENLEIFAHAGGGRSMAISTGRRFDPVDIEVGPDGAIWISSWGREYGLKEADGAQVNEGRIYRIWPRAAPPRTGSDPKRARPIAAWSTKELVADLGSHLPVWRTNALDELVRRGMAALDLVKPGLRETRRFNTSFFWMLGRIDPEDLSIDALLAGYLDRPGKFVEPHQLVRVVAHRVKARGGQQLPVRLKDLLAADGARVRHEVVLAMRQVNETRWKDALLDLLANEQDRIVYYSGWGALMELVPQDERRALLRDDLPAVRRAALLSLLEEDALDDSGIRSMTEDRDEATRALAQRRLGGKARTELRGPALARDPARPHRDATPRPPVSVVARIASLPGRRYEEATLAVGTHAYTDRPYRLTDLPEELVGLTFIRTANSDADFERGPFLELDLRYPSTVYLADDQRGEQLPAWARGRWEPTDLTLTTDDAVHRLFKAELAAGTVRFGANRDGVRGRKGNYLVIVKPQLLSPPQTATTVAAAMARLEQADPERGRTLFLDRHGAGCALCHQLEGFGNVFAPDLAGIGARADAPFVARSILEPSADITEGFAMQVLTTTEGGASAGIVLEETGRSVKLALVNGSTVTIEKERIASRETAPLSAMPPTFAGLLTPQDVADITAYLLAPRKERAPVQGTVPNPKPTPVALPGKPSPLSGRQWGDKGKGFYLDCHDVRLEIRYNGVEIASYYYRHPETKRPFFAHVKTPTGLQVTRNFPPHEGVDATDHGTMHPGLWLGFANLSGISFWHNNQGVVVHEEFLGEPTAGAAASFAVRNRYLAPDGTVICEERCHYRLVSNDDGYLLTIDSRFSGGQPFWFGVKEEMGLGLRVATPIAVKQHGAILSAGGGRNEKGTWGTVDRWWDYFGPLGPGTAGIQVMSGPGNPETWSHSRDYGVLVANPFPVDRPPNRGRRIEIPAGQQFRLRFGVQVHEHARRADYDPEAAYKRYLKRTN